MKSLVMKILFKYRLKKALFFLIFIVINSLDAVSQTYITWNTSVGTNGVTGTYPVAGSNGIVTATLVGAGDPLLFESPAPIDLNLIVTGNRTFSTSGPNNLPPAQNLVFNFTVPVVITRFNVADIDRSNGRWDDSYNFVGVAFNNTTSTNCISTVNGVTATGDFPPTGHNEEFATWRNSCNLINTFTINYLTTANLTTAYLAYSMEVCVPFDGINLGPFCINSVSTLPTTIACGITGTWSPATVNTSVIGTFNYTFTPNAGQAITCPITAPITIVDCCVPTLTSATTISTRVRRERSIWIKSEDVINFGSVVPGDGVVYHAGNFVELNPGFVTGSSACFAAYIEGCTGNYAYRPQATVNKKMQDIIGSIKQSAVKYKSQDFLKTHSGEPDISNSILVYPIPANNIVEISTRSVRFNQVSIVAIDGKKIFEKNFESSNRLQVDIGRYASGVYIVKIITENGQVFLRKLIKN